jgi:opacity protein-like surface antigen
MLKAFRTSLLVIFALTPAIAIAAPVKKAHKTVTTTTVTTVDAAPVAAAPAAAPAKKADEQATLFGAGVNSNANMMSSLKGLSVFAAYDFADTLETSNGGKNDTERAFDIGATYETAQITTGIAVQGSLEYDFSRAFKNVQNPSKFSQILPSAELTAHLTPAFKVMGGLNYSFPSVDNAPGVTLKGNVGYQFGASFAFTPHLALDARYRSVQYDWSTAVAAGQASQSISVKENGFLMGGRFMF